MYSSYHLELFLTVPICISLNFIAENTEASEDQIPSGFIDGR